MLDDTLYDPDKFWQKIDNSEFKIEVMGDFARRRILELLNVHPGDRILDAGCGTGRLARVCARAGAEVVGVDSDPEMLEVAREHEKNDYHGVHYVQQDITSENIIHCSGSRFDTIFSSAALMHNHPWAQSRAFRPWIKWLLKPHGKIILSVLPHPELFTVARTGKSALVAYDDSDQFPDTINLDDKRPVTERYTNGKTGQVFLSEIYLLDEVFYQKALKRELGGDAEITTEYVTITPDMLEQCGFPHDDPAAGAKSHIIITAREAS